MKPSPAPWEYENVSQCSDRSGYAVVKDANGKSLFDTINSDVACISTERDEGSVTYTDEQGRVDLMLAAAAPDLLAACKLWDELLPEGKMHSMAQYLTLGDTIRNAARAAVKKAEGSRDVAAEIDALYADFLRHGAEQVDALRAAAAQREAEVRKQKETK